MNDEKDIQIDIINEDTDKPNTGKGEIKPIIIIPVLLVLAIITTIVSPNSRHDESKVNILNHKQTTTAPIEINNNQDKEQEPEKAEDIGQVNKTDNPLDGSVEGDVMEAKIATDGTNVDVKLKKEKLDLIRMQGFTSDGKPNYLYNKEEFNKKVKGMSEVEFIEAMEKSKYTTKYDDYDPFRLFSGEEINCQGLTIAVIDYIDANYDTNKMRKEWDFFLDMSISSESLHVYPVVFKTKDVDETTGLPNNESEMDLIDLSVNKSKGIKSLTTFLNNIKPYRIK